MIRISKIASYATLVLVFLAKRADALLSARDLSKQLQLSLPIVSKLLKILLEGGLVSSVRGASGGYQLARDPKTITLADVITVVDGAPALTACCTNNYACANNVLCATKNNWQEINSVFVLILQNVTLLDMTTPLHEHSLLKNLNLVFSRYGKNK
jgi:FeS assembly SUF system regulator